MIHRSIVALTMIGLLLAAAPLAQADPPLQTDPDALAQAFVDAFLSGDFETAVAHFNSDMIQAIPADKLQTIYTQLVDQVGPYQDQVALTDQRVEAQQITVVVITLQFEKAQINVQVSVSDQGEIAGLYFNMAAGQADTPQYELPDYADPSRYEERDITVGEGGDWPLPSTLTMPTGEGPFPAVVLIHGSGPNDRDESIGPNKPFKDLALGLASQGVAVLRYDKRTRVYPQAFQDSQDFTVQQETIDDALAALDLLRQTEGIDPQRVFLLGHSLGGYLLPRIATQTQQAAGMIIWAGNTSPVQDLVLVQSQYLADLDGTVTDAEQTQLDQLAQLVQQINDLKSVNDASGLLLGAPAAYWLDLRTYDPVATAETLSLPILVMQGERDYQVTLAEFQAWREGLAGKEAVTFKTYPGLNHLFLMGSGPAQPSEYDIPGHVEKTVIDDLANWIQTH